MATRSAVCEKRLYK